jgi:hypothetical protein
MRAALEKMLSHAIVSQCIQACKLFPDGQSGKLDHHADFRAQPFNFLALWKGAFQGYGLLISP